MSLSINLLTGTDILRSPNRQRLQACQDTPTAAAARLSSPYNFSMIFIFESVFIVRALSIMLFPVSIVFMLDIVKPFWDTDFDGETPLKPTLGRRHSARNKNN